MTTMEIGKKLVELCNAGKHDDALKALYGEDIVSVEAAAQPGGSGETRGIAAVKKKGDDWSAAHVIHSTKSEGPFPHGDRFAVVHEFDITQKSSGQRIQMREVAVYTVKNDKIVREEFFYSTGQ